MTGTYEATVTYRLVHDGPLHIEDAAEARDAAFSRIEGAVAEYREQLREGYRFEDWDADIGVVREADGVPDLERSVDAVEDCVLLGDDWAFTDYRFERRTENGAITVSVELDEFRPEYDPDDEEGVTLRDYRPPHYAHDLALTMPDPADLDVRDPEMRVVESLHDALGAIDGSTVLDLRDA